MAFLTEVEVPSTAQKSFYNGFHLHNAVKCLKAGFEENAASWMWRDAAEIDSEFSPVAGTLRVSMHGYIEYVDARDIASEIVGMHGDGI